MTSDIISAIKGVGRVLADTYRLGFRAWIAAPALIAIVVLPEFVQHVVEIRLGMFVSLERFQDLSQDPTRWAFGYAKVAGVVIAMLAIARFWATASIRRTLLIPPADLLRLVFAMALTWAISLPFDWLATRGLPVGVTIAVHVVSALIQCGLLVFVVAALIGDRALTLRTAFTKRWPTALVMALAVACAFLPMQLLHMLNHKVALGQPVAIVWALMTWDALVVGMISALVGSALWAAYRSGATWSGWASLEESALPDGTAASPEGGGQERRRRHRPGPRPRF